MKLLLLRRAQKELAQLPPEDYDPIKDAIQKLEGNPRPRGSRKIKGRPGWRVRVGKYRVIYEIDDKGKTVTVFHVGHRRDVYR